jgi:GNAT superfamily N-acetyltransferase
MTSATNPVVRLATSDDVDELVRLRAVMFDLLGQPSDEDGPRSGWRAACRHVLAEGLTTGTVAGAVAEAPDGAMHLVACGVVSVWQRLPGPGTPDGRYGYIASMVTEEAWRGRGLAGAIVRGLLDWFDGIGVHRVDLHASAQGEPVYRALGFTESTYPELRWRRAPLSGGIGLAP